MQNFLQQKGLQTCKCKILFKIVEKVSKYEKNNTIHNGCWRSGPEQAGCTQETTAMLFAYTNATLLLKWSKERSDVQTQVSKGKKSESFFECLF